MDLMMVNDMQSIRQNERGTVLIIALVMLASLTLISTAAVDSAVMGLRISRNVEEQINAGVETVPVVVCIQVDVSKVNPEVDVR